MDETAFREELQRDGYVDVRIIDWVADKVSGSHIHEFSARGMLLTGAVTVKTDDVTMVCEKPGDRFALEAGTPHVESAGPDGAQMLIGRKYQY